MSEESYRECMAEIIGILQKYDMAGAITIVSKERSMFKYHFPTWSVIQQSQYHVRFNSMREDFPSKEAQHRATELSAHIIMQMRDIAAVSFADMDRMGGILAEKLDIEHTPFADFDPERPN
jgi:hypothetical protein